VIREDMFIKGTMRNGRRVEVHGYVEGEIVAESLQIGRKGRVFGNIRVANAEIEGQLQGRLIASGLIRIAATGSVNGNVLYGQLAMEPGAALSAEVRNVPPELAGDLHLVVGRGQAVAVTPADLSAFDPDDAANALTFRITNPQKGWIVIAGDNATPVERFTLADLNAGKVVFVHDGSAGGNASFDVLVADAAGATSGGARTVNVSVMGAG
jgi:cytoskeletal protein CcmA (bactofilin family)